MNHFDGLATNSRESLQMQESIAHYRIVSKLGEGGIGGGYRATDTKLNRDVAIQVLPDAFAIDPDRLARIGQSLPRNVIARPQAAGDCAHGK
jgi:hypothetical protein